MRGVTAAAAMLMAGMACAGTPDERVLPVVEIEADSPVALAAAEWGESRTFLLGSARVFELRGVLMLKNRGPACLRAVSVSVSAGAHAPGGRGVVRSPVLHVAREATAPIRITLRLCRPAAEGGAVGVRLDGALFEGPRFYGPDTWQSREWLTARERNAWSERRRLSRVLGTGGVAALREEMVALLDRESRPDVEGRRLADVYREKGMPALLEELAGY